jgi:hypothetical protein
MHDGERKGSTGLREPFYPSTSEAEVEKNKQQEITCLTRWRHKIRSQEHKSSRHLVGTRNSVQNFTRVLNECCTRNLPVANKL